MPRVRKSPTVEGTQHQPERAGGEIAEHAAPGGTDGNTRTRKHRRNRGRLDAEVAEYPEHQGDVEHQLGGSGSQGSLDRLHGH